MNLLNILKLKFFALLTGLPLVLLAAMQPALAGTPIDKTVTASANGSVHISSVAGSIKVETWNRNQIHVGGTLSRDAKRLDIEKSSTGVTIKVVLPHDSWGSMEGSHLVVQLPAASHLRVNTVSADVTADGLSGPVRLETVSGEIGLRSTSADIGAKTVSGDVEISGSAAQAQIDAESISGEVKVKNIRGTLHAESVSGDVEIDGSNTLSGAKMNTTSGDIEFTGSLSANGGYEFNSVSGDLKLEFSGTPAASFDASSLSGDITTNFGPAPQRTSEYGPGREWHYQNGSGKAEVRLHTMSGDIKIRATKP